MRVKSKVRPASCAFPFCFLGAAMWVASLAPGIAAAAPERIDYNYHIKPLLSDRCYACHGPDEKARKAKLRLDLKEGAFRVTDGKAIIAPGKSADSELYKRLGGYAYDQDPGRPGWTALVPNDRWADPNQTT